MFSSVRGKSNRSLFSFYQMFKFVQFKVKVINCLGLLSLILISSSGFLLWFVLHLNFYFMNFCNIFSYELGISVQNHGKQNWSHGWSYSQNQLHLNTKWHFDIIFNNVLTNFTNNPRPISGHLALGRFNFSNEQTFSGKKIGMPLINICDQ